MTDRDEEAKAKAAGQRYLAAFLALFFVGGALYMWRRAYDTYRLAHVDASTTCTVLDGSVDEASDSKDHTSYAVRLHVAHEVDGKRYEATDTSEYASSRSDVAARLETYRWRGTVPCNYAKSSPELVAVFQKTTGSYVTEFVFGAAFLGIAAVAFKAPGAASRRKRRR